MSFTRPITPPMNRAQVKTKCRTLQSNLWSRQLACATHGGGCKRSIAFLPLKVVPGSLFLVFHPICKRKYNKRRERKKSILTLASYACNRHHGWHTQATWSKPQSLRLCKYVLSSPECRGVLCCRCEVERKGTNKIQLQFSLF